MDKWVPSTTLSNNITYITIAIVVVVIIIIIFYIIFSYGSYDYYGVWTANDSFLHEAGLSMFFLHLGKDNRGYLIVIKDDGDVIANHEITFKVYNKYWLFGTQYIQFTNLEEFLSDEQREFFPDTHILSIDTQYNKMKIINPNTEPNEVTAILYKDFESTEYLHLRASNAEYDTPYQTQYQTQDQTQDQTQASSNNADEEYGSDVDADGRGESPADDVMSVNDL
jgi:hypothetical protein